MNCEDFEPILIEAARGESQPDALEHAGTCARCARKLGNERALTAAFAALDATSQDAPAALESVLLAAFAMRTKRRAVSGRAWVAVGGAIAAAILLALSWRTPPRKVLPALPVARLEEQPASTPQAAVVMRVAPPHKRPRPRAVRASAVASAFYAIPYAEPLTPVEHAEVVRVKVDDRLNAELIVGQDGLARAIRFINTSQ